MTAEEQSQYLHAYHPWLRKVAEKWEKRFPDCEFEDLYQEAAWGMLQGLHRNLSYVRRRSEGAIVDFILRETRMSNPPSPAWEVEEQYGESRTVPSTESLYIERAELRWMYKAVMTLPEKERMTIEKYYFDDWAMKEIGEVRHVSDVSIANYHKHALKLLRNAYRKKYECQWRED